MSQICTLYPKLSKCLLKCTPAPLRQTRASTTASTERRRRSSCKSSVAGWILHMVEPIGDHPQANSIVCLQYWETGRNLLRFQRNIFLCQLEILHSPPYLPTTGSPQEVCDAADEDLNERVYQRYSTLITEEQHKICTKQVTQLSMPCP